LIVPEPVIPGNDQPNSYGPVVYKKGEMRLRESGGVWSVWKGRRLELVVEEESGL
jgi:hypothetical protein